MRRLHQDSRGSASRPKTPSTRSGVGHRQANAAIYRTVIVRMRFHEPTIDYVARRTVEGLSKKDIIRCLKRFVAREVYQRVMIDHRARLSA